MLFASDFKSRLKVGESPSPISGHGFLIDSVDELSWNRALIPFLNDVIAKLFFVVGSGKQCYFEYLGGEHFIGFGSPLLGETGGGKAEDEDKVRQSA